MTEPSSTTDRTLTSAECDLLGAIQAEEVGWRQDGRRGASYRRWTSEHEYVLVTRLAKRLVADGFAKQEMAAGYAFVMRGPVVLTRAGRAALTRSGTTARSTAP